MRLLAAAPIKPENYDSELPVIRKALQDPKTPATPQAGRLAPSSVMHPAFLGSTTNEIKFKPTLHSGRKNRAIYIIFDFFSNERSLLIEKILRKIIVR
jgi:hypothetical protein